MKKPAIKFLAMALAVIMLVGVVPVYAFAASIDYDTTRADDYYKLISKKDWELAPGITESEIVLNNAAGSHRQVAHVVEVDLSNPYTKVIPSSYKMAEGLENKDYQVQIMSQQAAYAEANDYGNVVAAMNISLSWYNSAYYANHPELVGEPLGYLVLDGELYKNSQGQTAGAQTCLVINFDEKDGVARPADMPKVLLRSTGDPITGWEEQVIPANFGFLVKDGKNQYSKVDHTSDPASRSFMGIKADGTFVMVMNDGRQSPYSAGFNSYEMAEFMLSLGCVYAVNGDGGGSSAFLSQRPGEELKLNSSPSDGAERPTTHGILVISTAPSTGEFVRATISAESDYYTPGSTVQFSAIGTDLVGNVAEIPADVSWKLEDDSFGTINDGVFVSNGKEGEVTAQMIYKGEVVGEASITIVLPEIAFRNDTIVIGYGDTMALPVEVTTNEGRNPVAYKAGDIVYTFSDEKLGTLDGDMFTACDESTGLTNGTITAVICGQDTKKVSANIRFGKASEIVYDFEDGQFPVDTSNTGNVGGDDATESGKYIYGWHISDSRKNGYYGYRWTSSGKNTPIGADIPCNVYLANKSNGLVRNGNYAMGVDIDWTNVTASCHGQMQVFLPQSLDLTDATSVGFWMYVPAELVTDSMQIKAGFLKKDATSATVSAKIADHMGKNSGVNNGGWFYFSWPVLDTYKSFEYIEINSHYTAGEGSYNYYQNVTFYVDDITIDYSDATIDRENPYFSNLMIADENGNGVEITNQTITTNTVSLVAQAYENTVKTNATGLNRNSVKLYVDGVLSNAPIFTTVGGAISVPDLYLNDGVHTLVMEICDNQGNVGNIVRKLVVNTAKSDVRLEVPAASGLLPTGSIYWLNVVADNLAKVDSVTITVNLDYVNTWELEGMEVAYGFEAKYSINSHNDAVITFTRTGDAIADTTILAKLPVRIWMAKGWMDDSGIRKDYISNDPAKQDKYWILTPHAMWYSDGTRDYRLVVSAEAGVVTYVDGSTMTFSANETVIQTEMNRYYTNSDRQGKWSFHICTPGTAQSKAPTCTESGYTNRVFCVGCACGSVDNLETECDTHNGCGSVIDWGIIVPALGHSYKVTGDKLVCDCGHTITDSGLLIVGDQSYYALNGSLRSGWIEQDGNWYYFDKTTFAGVDGEAVADNGVTFTFDNGRLVTGTWVTDSVGKRYWYGPTYYRDSSTELTSSKAVEIDGKIYLFNRAGYMQTGVVNSIAATTTYYYDCGTDGVAKLYTGPHKNFFCVDGIKQERYQLFFHEGYYYYVADGNKLVMNNSAYMNKILEGTDLTAGVYYFDDQGRMILPEIPEEPEVKNGVVGDYFYIDGVQQVRYQLIKYEGSYYYVADGNKVIKNGSAYMNKILEGTGLPAGTYYFDADGKMILPEIPEEPEVKNGVVGDYFYVDGVKQLAYQLIKYENNYYYVGDGNKVVKDDSVYMNKVLAGTGLTAGEYYFDADGKMVLPETPEQPEVKNGVVGNYFYLDGVQQLAYQLIKYENNYYYVGDGNKVVKDDFVYMNKVLEGTDLVAGSYYFDADGKLILD